MKIEHCQKLLSPKSASVCLIMLATNVAVAFVTIDALTVAAQSINVSSLVLAQSQDAESFYRQGVVKLDKKDYRGAVSDFTKAIELKPNYADAYYDRGRANFFLQAYRAAFSDASETIRLKPDQAGAYRLRGGLLIIFKEYRQAIPDFTAAIRLDPNYPDAYYWRGHAKYFVSGQERAAILDFDAAIRLNPTYTEAYYMRGRAKRFLGEYRAAIADLTEAIRLNPNHIEAYVERGTAINGTTGPNGNLRQALADFNTAIRLDSNHAFAYHGRAVVKSNLSSDYWGALDDATVAARLYKEQGDSENYQAVVNYINTLRDRTANEQRGRDLCIVYNSDGTVAYTTTRDRAPSGGGVECRPR